MELRISRSTPAGLTKRFVRTFCTILKGAPTRAAARRASGVKPGSGWRLSEGCRGLSDQSAIAVLRQVADFAFVAIAGSGLLCGLVPGALFGEWRKVTLLLTRPPIVTAARP